MLCDSLSFCRESRQTKVTIHDKKITNRDFLSVPNGAKLCFDLKKRPMPF